ncbi:hypothetical protein ACOSQ2_017329 [Xanthoceras sorbifolium]
MGHCRFARGEDKQFLSDHPGAMPITTAQGEELKKMIGAVTYIECSSKTQQTVFDAAIKVALKSHTNQGHESDRVVTKKEGINFAREYGCLFIECSAKTCDNVQQCFEELVLMKDNPTSVILFLKDVIPVGCC